MELPRDEARAIIETTRRRYTSTARICACCGRCRPSERFRERIRKLVSTRSRVVAPYADQHLRKTSVLEALTEGRFSSTTLTPARFARPRRAIRPAKIKTTKPVARKVAIGEGLPVVGGTSTRS